MKKYAVLIGLFLFQFAVLFPVFAQSGETAAEPDNEFFAKSLSLTQQAKDAYEEGDYDASMIYAEEAVKYAKLSDDYVAGRLSEAAAIAWAGTMRQTGQGTGQTKVQAAGGGTAIAQNAAPTQASSPPKGPAQTAARPDGTFPAQYVVRNWRTTGDSFSAIAGRPWVYGDARQWRTLYEANKDKLPNPDNPHLILPGMVLDIPSVAGETRQGVWTP